MVILLTSLFRLLLTGLLCSCRCYAAMIWTLELLAVDSLLHLIQGGI